MPITGHEILANYIVPKSKLADTDIRQLEERIGAELPFDYRAFLEKYNGGYLKVNVAFPIARIRDVSWLHMLYGLGEIDPAYSLIESVGALPELSHLRLLPVGNDPLNSKICISVEPGTFGHIYYWDWTRRDSPDHIHFLSKSFDEFVATLHFYFEWKSEAPATETMIDTFQKRNQAELPDDYKSFLLKHNGRVAKTPVCFATSKADLWQLTRMFGIGLPLWKRKMRVEDRWSGLRKKTTHDLIPIGCDWSDDDLICFERLSGVCSKIVFWHQPTASTLHVANSLSEFLEMLEPCPHPDPIYFVNPADQYKP